MRWDGSKEVRVFQECYVIKKIERYTVKILGSYGIKYLRDIITHISQSFLYLFLQTTVTLGTVPRSCQLSWWTSHSPTINISTRLKVTIFASGVIQETAGYLLYKGSYLWGTYKNVCKILWNICTLPFMQDE